MTINVHMNRQKTGSVSSSSRPNSQYQLYLVESRRCFIRYIIGSSVLKKQELSPNSYMCTSPIPFHKIMSSVMAFFTASRLSSLMSPQNNGLVRTFENQMGNKANQSQNDGLFSVFFCLFISGCFSLSTEFMFAVALIITLDKYLSFSDIPPPTL